MADENLNSYIINYTTNEFDNILKKADNGISTKLDNETMQFEKAYITPYHGGLGPEVPKTNHILIGDTESKIKTIQSTPGAFYSESTDLQPKYGILPIKFGGTGVQSLSELKKALGLSGETSDDGSLSSAINVPFGGTGRDSFPINGILVGNGSENLKTIDPPTGELSNEVENFIPQILMSNGAGNCPIFKEQDQIRKVGIIKSGTWEGNTIAVNYGGTGVKSMLELSQALGLGATTTGAIPTSRGGTGVKTYQELRVKMGLGTEEKPFIVPINYGGTGTDSLASLKANLNITYNDINMSNITIPEINGGTGYSSFADALNNIDTSSDLTGLKIALDHITKTEIEDNYYNKNIIDEKVNNIKSLIPEEIKLKQTKIKLINNNNESLVVDDINNNNLILDVNNNLDIIIDLPYSGVDDGNEFKLIKRGSKDITIQVTISGNTTKIVTLGSSEEAFDLKANQFITFVFIEGNWYYN